MNHCKAYFLFDQNKAGDVTAGWISSLTAEDRQNAKTINKTVCFMIICSAIIN